MPAFLLLLAFALCINAVPVWPDVFSQPFNETALVGHTTGYYYYDWPNRRARTDRENGAWDRYCGSVHPFVTTPCQHIVRDGVRYLNFPRLNKCCACCTAAKGCGVLYPNWFEKAGAKYLGHYKSRQGIMCDKWEIKGLQSNYYYETKEGIMAELMQMPNDDQVFDVHRFKKGCSLPDSLFQLPPNCSKQCGGPVCALAEHNLMEGLIR
eukprot:CAMPEP_0174297718 /NCGR_PEP_ID=MMETSP0809-20121228/51782_1 /TAXON_ID=73025 ORGANISM="Eutreptiella gymnastica-like, Strain CCMP1594" /NCGR_SAMPLE_ID=MMETSP0809 /ASSEMBLY_ACC=CAM_ASM_000658 /LENGTH=208 /DNA_ID=CAMNT_0015401693 /DNA_START=32 /DNA_END=658 /DNA_ORIENTATION=+